MRELKNIYDGGYILATFGVNVNSSISKYGPWKCRIFYDRYCRWYFHFICRSPSHGHLLRTAHKLSATKIEHSQWSTGHSTHLWLADKNQTNLWAWHGCKQGVKVGTLGRQIDKQNLYIWFVFYVTLPNEIKLLLFNIFFFGRTTTFSSYKTKPNIQV